MFTGKLVRTKKLTNQLNLFCFINIHKQLTLTIYRVSLLLFLAFDFVGYAWSFNFSSPPQRPMTSDFEGFSIPDFIRHIYFPILILEKEPLILD